MAPALSVPAVGACIALFSVYFGAFAALTDRCQPSGTAGLRCDIDSSLSVARRVQLKRTEKFSLNFTAPGAEVTYIYLADHDDAMKQSIQCELNDMYRGACAAWGKSTKDLLADGNNVVTQFKVPEDGMHTSMQCIKGANSTDMCSGWLTTRYDPMIAADFASALSPGAVSMFDGEISYKPIAAAEPIARVAPVQLIQLSGTRADPRQSVYVRFRSSVELDLSIYGSSIPSYSNQAAMIAGSLTVASSGIPIRECMNEPLSSNLNCVFISFAAFCGEKLPNCGIQDNSTDNMWGPYGVQDRKEHTINCTLSLPAKKCNFTYEAVSATGTNDRFFATATLQLYKMGSS